MFLRVKMPVRLDHTYHDCMQLEITNPVIWQYLSPAQRNHMPQLQTIKVVS